MSRELLMGVASLAVLILAGCGGQEGPERVIVTGKVTYNGEPIQNGEIRFVPTKETNAPVSGAPIIDGTYTVTAKGGVPVGKHKVVIEGFRKPQNSPNLPANMSEAALGGQGAAEQYIPQKFNARTTLELAVESGQTEISKDFELSSEEGAD